jgi:hypothetical protein
MHMIRRIAVFGLVLLAACDSGRLGAPRGSTGGTAGTSGGATFSGLVGTWRRIIFFIAEDGSAGANETIWRFNSSGSATRTSITRNYTAGLADAQIVDARFELLSQSVRITFLPPSSGTFEYSFRVTGDTLYLASQGYGRIAQ